jgi:hypothetical protein
MKGPDESEIAEFDGAVGVNEDVGGFEVAVYDFSGVQVFEGFGQLVDDEAYVYVFEYVLCDDVVQICFHELEEEIDVAIVVCPYGLVEFYDVGVVELS